MDFLDYIGRAMSCQPPTAQAQPWLIGCEDRVFTPSDLADKADTSVEIVTKMPQTLLFNSSAISYFRTVSVNGGGLKVPLYYAKNVVRATDACRRSTQG